MKHGKHDGLAGQLAALCAADIGRSESPVPKRPRKPAAPAGSAQRRDGGTAASCLTLDQHGLVVEANLPCAAVLGIEPQRLLRYRFSQLVSPPFQAAWRQLMSQALAGAGGERHRFDGVLHRDRDAFAFTARIDLLAVALGGQVAELRLTITELGGPWPLAAPLPKGPR